VATVWHPLGQEEPRGRAEGEQGFLWRAGQRYGIRGRLRVEYGVAGVGPYLPERRTEICIENCRRFSAGRPLHNVVDKANWF